MGAYLSKPVLTKIQHFEENERFVVALSSMQGWRRTMEDGHVICMDIEQLRKECDSSGGMSSDNAHNPLSFFAVLDGHGGDEVARFAGKYLSSIVAGNRDLLKGNYKKAIVDSFHAIDTMIDTEPYTTEIKQMSGDLSDSNQSSTSSINSSTSATETISTATTDARSFLANLLNENAGKHDTEGTPASVDSDHEGSDFHWLDAGSTVVAALITKDEIICGWAGDSRCVYALNGTVTPLSFDHKPEHETEKARIENANGTVQLMPGGHYRINGNLNVSRALGDKRYKTNTKIPPAEQIITAEPDFNSISLSNKDSAKDNTDFTNNEILLLACDGVWDVMTNERAIEFIDNRLQEYKLGHYKSKDNDCNQAKTLNDIANELLDECISKDPKLSNGLGCDNMTAIIILIK